MLDDYLIVHKSILPDYFEKILEARHYLASGEAANISAATKKAGISRSTYYKYNNYIMETSSIKDGRLAVLTMILTHAPGVLSSLLQVLSEAGGSVVTIMQSPPIHKKAQLTISIDICGISCTTEELLSHISKIHGVEKPRLIAVE